MSLLRHGEIYRSDVTLKPVRCWGRSAASRWSAPGPSQRTRRKERARLIVHDEFPVGYSLAGCSPAEPASASPTGSSMRWNLNAGYIPSANGNLSLLSVSQPKGPLQGCPSRPSRPPACPRRPHQPPPPESACASVLSRPSRMRHGAGRVKLPEDNRTLLMCF